MEDISGALNMLLTDIFVLYFKTKNFHWHMSGPNFRDYHLLLDEHAEQIYATTDAIAERVRKIGATTRHITITAVTEQQCGLCAPLGMVAELRADNLQLGVTWSK